MSRLTCTENIAVIGGGVIGLACAITLIQSGRAVALFDPADPGAGCSFGNAGLIATSEIYPPLNLRRMAQLPRMLADPLGPVSLNVGDLPALVPWFWRALSILPPARQDFVARSIATLNREATAAWRALLTDAGARHLLVERGMLEVIRPPFKTTALLHDQRRMARHGFDTSILDAGEVERMEPALAGSVSGALFHPDTGHVQDPHRVSQALETCFRNRGGRIVRTAIKVIREEAGGLSLETGEGRFAASHAVVSAGIASHSLLRSFGLKVPMIAERGYHHMLPLASEVLSRPVVFRQESFVATPMSGGLRLAGTVEFAHEDSKPNWRRSAQLLGLAKRYLGPLPAENASQWVGSRPSLPDFMPAIGRVGRSPSIVYAFGHQHLGLTQAAVTARHVRALVDGEDVPAVRPFSLTRFA